MSSPPRTVGIRELKAHTSALLRAVQEDGAEIIVTVHGRPVARIEPVGEAAETSTDGMGGTRGVLSGRTPEAGWDDFDAAKQLWSPRMPDAG